MQEVADPQRRPLDRGLSNAGAASSSRPSSSSHPTKRARESSSEGLPTTSDFLQLPTTSNSAATSTSNGLRV